MSTKVEQSILVNVPISVAYNQWTQFEDFPQFMGGVKKVTQLGDDRLEWVAEIAGVKTAPTRAPMRAVDIKKCVRTNAPTDSQGGCCPKQ